MNDILNSGNISLISISVLITEIIIITERNNASFTNVINELYDPTIYGHMLIRFVPKETFIYNLPKNIQFVPHTKLSERDIEHRKQSSVGYTITGTVSINDPAIIWHGFRSGDTIIAKPRTLTAFEANLIYKVI